jgi:hypothetical protein
MDLQKRFQHFFVSVACGLASLAMPAQSVLADESVDATDPTKIYSYLGAGLKYTEYTNGEFMWELRATGNIGLTESDMLLFEGAMVNTMVIRPRVATPAERAFEFAGFICSIWIMS